MSLTKNALGCPINNYGAEPPLTTQVSNLTDFFFLNQKTLPKAMAINNDWLVLRLTNQATYK